MVFPLPTSHGPADSQPQLISGATDQEAYLVGADQRSVPLGSRFSLDVNLPPLEFEHARLWVAALLRSEVEEVTMEFLQVGSSFAAAPDLRVASAVTANARAVALRTAAGAVSSYPAKAGQFFNVVKDGRRYLHNVSQDNTTPLMIAPAFRLPLADGDQIDFNTVLIQGWVQNNGMKWTVDNLRTYGVSITIKEAE